MARRLPAMLLSAWLLLAHAHSHDDLVALLDRDDECQSNAGGDCSLNALQLRKSKVSDMTCANRDDHPQRGECISKYCTWSCHGHAEVGAQSLTCYSNEQPVFYE